MAKKPRPRSHASTAARHPTTARLQRPWWQHKIAWGSGALLLVIGLGVLVRYVLFRPVLPQLQGAVGQHYTRGPGGAPVVLKEFSDYT